MAIRVEFFGIARQRAGAVELTLEPPGSEIQLADLLKQIAEQAPRLGQTLLVGGQLHESLMVNVDGNRFVRDPETVIHDGQSVLILSADAGG
jgi:molybdopterin converting factor small subunit